eukprot:GEMP01017675.1.p1 GENE.GEMP01017675.1~~GEMP01017675.1.p1  ORF type:complete len:666 (+),score=131.52 GEMP01017675.1:188-2185(+)
MERRWPRVAVGGTAEKAFLSLMPKGGIISLAASSGSPQSTGQILSEQTINDLFQEYISQEEGSSVWEFHNYACLLRNCKFLSCSFSYQEAVALWQQVIDETEFVDEDAFPDLLNKLARALKFPSIIALYTEIQATQFTGFRYDNMDPLLRHLLHVGHRPNTLAVMYQYHHVLQAFFNHYKTTPDEVTGRNMYRLCTALGFIPDVVVPQEVIQICRALYCGPATRSSNCANGLYSRKNVPDSIANAVRWFDDEKTQQDLTANPAACTIPLTDLPFFGEPIWDFPRFVDVIMSWILHSAPPLQKSSSSAEIEERIHEVFRLAQLPQMPFEGWSVRSHFQSLFLKTDEDSNADNPQDGATRKPEPKWGEICYFAKPEPPQQCDIPADLARHRVAELQPWTDRTTRVPLKEPVRTLCIVEPLEPPDSPMDILIHIEAASVRRNQRDVEGSLVLLLKARALWQDERTLKFKNLDAMIDVLEETEPSTTVPLYAEVYFFLTFAALAELLEYEETSLVLVWKIKTFYGKSALGEPDDLTMGVIFDHIGLLAFHAKEYDMAARCYLTIAKLREKRVGDSMVTAVAYHNLGASYFQIGRAHEAGAYFDLALAIFQFSLGDANSRTQICRWNLKKVRQSYTKPLLTVPHIYYIPLKDSEGTKKKKKGAKTGKKKT